MNLDNTTIKNTPNMKDINNGNWPIVGGNKKIPAIRLFNYYEKEGRQWTKFLANNGFKVLIGIWIDNNIDGTDQIDAFIKDYKRNTTAYNNNVIGISVGNENNDEDGHQPVKAYILKGYITDVKNKLNDNNLDIPVTTTLAANFNVADKIDPSDDNWSTNNFKVGTYLEAIKNEIDFVSVNFYPYYNDDMNIIDLLLSTDPHESMLHNQIAQVQHVISKDNDLRGKKLWVTETGWAHKGNTVASEYNMKNYYKNILNLKGNKGIVPTDSTKKGDGNFDPRFDLPEWIFYFTFRDTDVNFGLIN
jgi:exo-beta-1,3-glucanase (GH17 family)